MLLVNVSSHAYHYRLVRRFLSILDMVSDNRVSFMGEILPVTSVLAFQWKHQNKSELLMKGEARERDCRESTKHPVSRAPASLRAQEIRKH